MPRPLNVRLDQERVRKTSAILQRIIDEHPDPPDLAARGYDVHDRKKARAAVARRLRRPGPRKR